MDTVVAAFTLCTIPDVEAALAEARRVLKPSGQFRYLEHGLHPDPKVAVWQRRIEPVWKVLAGGCHLTRDADELVRAAGFDLVESEHHSMPGPRFSTALYGGCHPGLNANTLGAAEEVGFGGPCGTTLTPCTPQGPRLRGERE